MRELTAVNYSYSFLKRCSLLLLLPICSLGAGRDEAVSDLPTEPGLADVQTPHCCFRARNIDLDAPMTNDLRIEKQHNLESLQRDSVTLQEELEQSFDKTLAVDRPPFRLLGGEVAAGTSSRLAWEAGYIVCRRCRPDAGATGARGESGPVMCLTAAVHGDELNGIEMVRRILYTLDPAKLAGTVIGVPIVDLLGFKRGSRYLPDRRDLNRYFPGNSRGSSASRIAHSFFTEVISACDVLVDLHTGSFHRTNLPQLRADLNNVKVRTLAQGFGNTVVVFSKGGPGTLRRAAVEYGIPAVTLEAGEPLRFQVEEVEHGVKLVFALMDQLGMYRHLRVWGTPHRCSTSHAGCVRRSAVFCSVRCCGSAHKAGATAWRGRRPDYQCQRGDLRAVSGRIIGMAVDQVVMPGYAAFHIGIRASGDDGDVWEVEAVGADDEGVDNEEFQSREDLEDASLSAPGSSSNLISAVAAIISGNAASKSSATSPGR